MTAKGVTQYRFKRMLEELKSKRGKGTELISLYITHDSDLSKVVQQLREEQGTASNIKSKTTRKNVIAALEKIIYSLRTYAEANRRPPKNGLAIFCGNVAGQEDAADIQLYWIEPPEPVTTKMYRCDQEFVLGPLKEMLEVKESVGLLTLDRREATFAILRGKHVEIVRHLTSNVPGKHGKGGQSARRFERLIEIAAHEFMKSIAESANEIFSKVPDLRAIIVGGPGPTKDDFLRKDLLRPEIREKIAASVDVGYTDECGVRELTDKVGGVLADLDIAREKELVRRFMEGLVDRGLVAYGEADVRKALESGAVETLLISEGLRRTRVLARCRACGSEIRETTQNVEHYGLQLAERACQSCGRFELELIGGEDIVEELSGLADEFGSRTEFISTETDEGKQLLMAFGGLAALLRFKVA